MFWFEAKYISFSSSKGLIEIGDFIETSVRSLNIDGLVQDYNISIANALEMMQSWTKPWRWCFIIAVYLLIAYW